MQYRRAVYMPLHIRSFAFLTKIKQSFPGPFNSQNALKGKSINDYFLIKRGGHLLKACHAVAEEV